MNLQEIQDFINVIKSEQKDNEKAHGLEDALRDEFIESISKRKDLLGKKAKLVLSTNKLDFGRWYA
ncbi:hypothetical protein LCGC14_1985690 [marine sediment metagenome]|uniref:Uncharacterized protein n=1 Tax=marine sediment metagenome TaxID=412755 RepID=A0A0F9FVN1_9ZZZZ